MKSPSLIKLKNNTDNRGHLNVVEALKDIPFSPERCFWISGVPKDTTRGNHAHKEQQQFLIALKGSLSVDLKHGSFSERFMLNKPNIGLHVPSLYWGELSGFSSDCILLVLASGLYDENEYINNFESFLTYVKD